MINTRMLANGEVERTDEAYRVVGNTHIIDKPGYLVYVKYRINGPEMVVEAPEFRAVLRRL